MGCVNSLGKFARQSIFLLGLLFLCLTKTWSQSSCPFFQTHQDTTLVVLRLPDYFSQEDLMQWKAQAKKLPVPPTALWLQEFQHPTKELLNHFQKLKLLIIPPKEVPPQTEIPSLEPSQFLPYNQNKLLALNRKESPKGTARLTILSIERDSIPDYQDILKIWRTTGRLPNLIVSSPATIKDAAQLANKINATRRLKAVVKSDDQILSNIHWKEYPNLVTSGHFTYPLIKSLRVWMSPYKPGYRFSPDILYFTKATYHKEMIFKAYPLKQEDGLVAHFPLEQNPFDLKNPNNQDLVAYDVTYTKDPERGPVAFFNGTSSWIDCGKAKAYSPGKALTISAWFKPLSFDEDDGILGKGYSYSFKFRNGNPTFTLPQIEDYSIEKTVAPFNKWTHLTISFVEGNYCHLYLNGQHMATHPVDSMVYTDHSLSIGSNLWAQYFHGYLNDIKIWNRELSTREVEMLYHNSVKPEKKIHFSWYYLLILIIIPISLWLMKRKKAPTSPPLPNIPITDPQTQRELLIETFGGFRVLNSNKEEITRLFSPKLRQLFMVILFHSLFGKQGITTPKLTQILWPDFTPQRAKNTRGTNIQRLRQLLSLIGGITLVFEEKKWRLDFQYPGTCDLVLVDKLMLEPREQWASPEFRELLKKVLPLLSRGRIVPSIDADWLDSHLEKLHTNLLDLLLELNVHYLTIEKESSLIYKTATAMLALDPLNEEALLFKLKALAHEGKHSIARKAFDSFAKEFEELYDLPYPKSFTSLLEV